MMRHITRLASLAGLLALGGCATQSGYQSALAQHTALTGNSRTFRAPPDQTFSSAKLTLVRQGFTIENADLQTGLIKATRNLQDKEDENVSYNVVASVDITPTSSARTESIVTASASQQTVLHREWHTWWHLLWILPLIPTGTEYQTVVTKEGNITEPGLYNDLFAAMEKDLQSRPAAEPAPVMQAIPVAAPISATPLPAANPAAQPAGAGAPADNR
jgi:hypothetical protein